MRKFAMLTAGALALAACSGEPEPKVDAAVEIGSAAHTAYNLSAARGGDLVAVAWNDYDDVAAVEAPFVAVSTDAGRTFEVPVPLDPDEPYAAYPQLAMSDDGTIYVAVTLYEVDEGDGRAALYRSDDRGATFDLVADLTDMPRVAFSEVGTSVAVSPDGETVIIAWTTPPTESAPSAQTAVVSVDGGTTFGEAVALADDAGGGRVRAYFDADGAGVIGTEHIALPDAPEPTPANPNPVTFTRQATVWRLDDGGFAPGRPLTAETVEPLDAGPAASGSTAAWWEPSGDGAALRFASNSDQPTDTRDVIVPLQKPANVEVVSDDSGTWFLTIDVQDAEGVAPAPLVLARQRGDDAVPVSVFTASITRSGEEYDLASVGDDTVVIAWLDNNIVRAQRVTA